MSSITELDYVNISTRAIELGCSMPEIAILPDNFHLARSRGELQIGRHATAARSMFENASFPLGSFCGSSHTGYFGEEDFRHWETNLFVSAKILEREPYVVSVALSIIQNHLTGFVAGEPERNVRVSFVVEKRDRTCRKLVYDGNIAGLRTLSHAIHKIAKE
ncbi:MAG TPA: hypothetical protein VHU23_04930 [Rhizomicrobium sp.]|jgi:hypothetical protein|nr:hypothetical protein [Rhizomicrobium sp.]